MKKEIRMARQKLYFDNGCAVCLKDISRKGIIWTRDKADDVKTSKDIFCSYSCLLKDFRARVGKVQTNALSTDKRVVTPEYTDCPDKEPAAASAARDIDAETEQIEQIEAELENDTEDKSEEK